jgi:hypothetical protein
VRNDERASDLFERLWLLRACYPMRSAYDDAGTLTIAQTIDYAERLMRAARWQQRRAWPGSTRQAA